MTNEEWKQFNLRVLATMVGVTIGFVIGTIILQDISAKHQGDTYRIVCAVEKGEKK